VTGKLLHRIPALTVGKRIRVTASWDGCADDVSGPAPGSVAVDFDVFLYHVDSQSYVWGSQSIFDNNEGFDFTVQEAGEYHVWLAWELGSKSCEGTSSERLGVALWRL
jgi:hypothetical protein